MSILFSTTEKNLVTREQVISCYQGLLGRVPESEQTIEYLLGLGMSLSEIILTIKDSQEFIAGTGVKVGSNFVMRGIDGQIDLEGSVEQIEILKGQVEQVWTDYGRLDPHWSVMTSDNFRADKIDKATEDVFFKTGIGEVNAFYDACKRAGIDINYRGCVLDFGCGVGRLGEHLSSAFAEYVGVDISAPHLALAKDRFAEIGRLNGEFVLLNDFLKGNDRFDAFYSIIVLQHNPPPIISMLLNNILDRINPNGVVFFQVPTTLYGYRFNLQEYISSSMERSMEMHAVPQHKILDTLARHGFSIKEVIFDGKCGPIGVSHTFLAQKFS